MSREMGGKVTIAIADGLRVEDRTENGMLESGEPEDRNCLEKHLTVWRAEFCADKCGAAIHVISPPLILLGKIEQFSLRIREAAFARDLAEPCREITVMRALLPPNPIARHTHGMPETSLLNR
jgi:hypothetical protein